MILVATLCVFLALVFCEQAVDRAMNGRYLSAALLFGIATMMTVLAALSVF
jgi:hypothetical protein